MKKAVFIKSFLISFIALMITMLFSAAVFNNQKEDQLISDMKKLIEVFEFSSKNISEESLKTLSEKSNTRVTYISNQGKVLFDSEADKYNLENHSDRKEIEEALKGQFGYERRKSESLSKDMLYIAKKIDSEGILRLSMPIDSLRKDLFFILPVFAAGIIIITILSAILAGKLSKSLTQPLSIIENSLRNIQKGKIKNTEYDFKYNEYNQIAKRINSISREIEENLTELSMEKEKIDYILNNTDEGLCLIDREFNIIHINPSALEYFNAENKENNFLKINHNSQVIDCIEKSFEQDIKEQIVIKNNSSLVLQIKFAPLFNGDNKVMLILINDITKQHNAQKLRADFFANASHELKTPITSIKGFAELIFNDIVKDENIKKDYLERIINDSDRLISLSDDILRLSDIEANTAEKNIEKINIKKIAEEVKNNIIPIANKMNVEVINEASDVYIDIMREDIFQIIQNLMVNAVKYNKENGKVIFKAYNKRNKAYIVVEDTGIGIEEKYQNRIFERFFRVDKSRSRNIGGTGLGLAIVKHLVLSYKGEISVSSEKDKGTIITICFGKEALQKNENIVE